jgi:hypothetical protein
MWAADLLLLMVAGCWLLAAFGCWLFVGVFFEGDDGGCSTTATGLCLLLWLINVQLLTDDHFLFSALCRD